MYARRKACMVYANAEALALDYGLHGTTAFFPLSQLVYDINEDERFRDHLRSMKYVGKFTSNL